MFRVGLALIQRTSGRAAGDELFAWQLRPASMGGLRDQKHKNVEDLRKKRQALKDAKLKRQEKPTLYDKAVLQAHQELEDERLFDERKKLYGVEVASQMLEDDRYQRDLKAWNDRRVKLRNKAKTPKMV